MPGSQPCRQSLRALDFLNVFLADVRDGVGPFLAIFLSSTLHWNPAQIGLAMSVANIATVVVQTPAGWLVDQFRAKRFLVILASLLVAAGCLVTITWTTLPVIISAQVLIGLAGAIFPPVTAAITLGLVGGERMSRQTGRNESFNHLGNVLTAALAGLAGHLFGPSAIFILVAFMGLGSVFSVLGIRPSEIDHERARGAASSDGPPVRLRDLLRRRGLVIFSLSTVLFHFANAAMLPLIGQKLGAGKDDDASLYMAACIIVAQIVMIPVALLAGRGANAWGRRPIFLIALAVLALRGFLYTLSDNPLYLVGVQSLDGIGAGIFGVMVVVIVADLTAGTGRFNFAQGALATATGLGASLSNLLTGLLVKHTGYSAGFLALSCIALLALLIFALFMPETRNPGKSQPA